MLTDIRIIQSLLYLWHDADVRHLCVRWDSDEMATMILLCSINPEEDRTPLTVQGITPSIVAISFQDMTLFKGNLLLSYTPSNVIFDISIEVQEENSKEIPLANKVYFTITFSNGSTITAQCNTVIVTESDCVFNNE